MPQIRLSRTPELEGVLLFLRRKYSILSEAEIIKVAIAEKYKRELLDVPLVDEETESLISKSHEDVKKGRFTVLRTDEDIDKHFDRL